MKNHRFEWQKQHKKNPLQLFAEKGDFSNKKRPKRDPKSGLGLLRDPGLPKRDPVGSSASPTIYLEYLEGTIITWLFGCLSGWQQF